MTNEITWPSASGNEKLTAITVGGETFVRHDHNAYDMGYSACKDDVRRALEKLWWWERMDDQRVEQIWATIDALPPKDEEWSDE